MFPCLKGRAIAQWYSICLAWRRSQIQSLTSAGRDGKDLFPNLGNLLLVNVGPTALDAGTLHNVCCPRLVAAVAQNI